MKSLSAVSRRAACAVLACALVAGSALAADAQRVKFATTAGDSKSKVRYQDSFQHNVGEKLETVGQKFAGKGRTVLYAIVAVVVLAILVSILYSWNRRTNGAAQAALGKAIETSQSRVTDTPPPAGSTDKTFKSEKERADAAIGDALVLSTDRGAGVSDLETLSSTNSEVGNLSKFALAQTRADDGKVDDAAKLYQDLAAVSDPVVAKDTINIALARIYEKQGKKQEAVDIYYNIAKAASDAKDADGKAVPMGETARDAKEKLTQLDPEKAKEIKDAPPDNPFGGGGPLGL